MKNKLCNYFIDRLIKNANNEEIKFILKLISAYFDDISERILGICEILKLLEKNDYQFGDNNNLGKLMAQAGKDATEDMGSKKL